MLIRITGCAYESRSNGGRERREEERETISIESERAKLVQSERKRERKTISIESERAKLVFSLSYKVKLGKMSENWSNGE